MRVGSGQPLTGNPRPLYRPDLHGRRWQAIRRAVLLRDRYRCRVCLRAARLEVDHIRPIRQGGEAWNLANLQTLCRGCHIDKTRRENTGRRRNRLPPGWDALLLEL